MNRKKLAITSALVLAGVCIYRISSPELRPSLAPATAAKPDASIKTGAVAVSDRSVMDVIAKEQARPSSGTSAAALKHQKPGAYFEANKTPPTARLIVDPEMGEVVELTFADGRKLYKPNAPTYDWDSGETKTQEFTN